MHQSHLTYASPNLAELRAMATSLHPDQKIRSYSELNEIMQLSRIMSNYIEFIIVTLGSKGVVTVRKSINKLEGRLYPTEALSKIHNVSGAGDCFSSGFIYGVLSGHQQSSCLDIAFQAAKSALLSENTVPHDLCVKDIHQTYYTSIDVDNS